MPGTNLMSMVYTDEEAEQTQVEVRGQEGGGRVALLVGGAHPGAVPDLKTTSGFSEARSEAKAEH